MAEAFDEEMYFTPQVKSEKSSGKRRNTPRSCRSTPKRAAQEPTSPQLAKENVLPTDQQATSNTAMDVLKKATGRSGSFCSSFLLHHFCLYIYTI